MLIICMHFLFNTFMDLIFYNYKEQIVFAYFYLGLQVTQCLFHVLVSMWSILHFIFIFIMMNLCHKLRRKVWPSLDVQQDGQIPLSPNQSYVDVSTPGVTDSRQLELLFATGKLSETLENFLSNILSRFLWMVYLGKHPWVGTLRYNQLV